MEGVVLGPDVYVNASVAPGTSPEIVTRRLLGVEPAKVKATPWILERVEAMLSVLPNFRSEALATQLAMIRGLVELVAEAVVHGEDDWESALVAAAGACGADVVITDHPDLLAKERSGGVLFMSTDAWLVERSMPPPPPIRG